MERLDLHEVATHAVPLGAHSGEYVPDRARLGRHFLEEKVKGRKC